MLQLLQKYSELHVVLRELEMGLESNAQIKRLMCLTADVTVMQAVTKPEFQQTYPGVDTDELKEWLQDERYQSVSNKAIKSVKAEKAKSEQAVREMLKKASAQLSPVSLGKSEGGSWKASLREDCSFEEVVKAGRPVMKGSSMASELTTRFNAANKDWQPPPSISL